MENNSFKYCILQYMHSQILCEVVNIGIFFQFPNGDMFFKHPKGFERVKGLYEDFDEEQLKRNLEALESKINGIINRSVNRKDFKIADIIKKDATVLQLSDVHTALIYDEPTKIMNGYYNLYFGKHFEK